MIGPLNCIFFAHFNSREHCVSFMKNQCLYCLLTEYSLKILTELKHVDQFDIVSGSI